MEVVWVFVRRSGLGVGLLIFLVIILAIGFSSDDYGPADPPSPFPELFVETTFDTYDMREYGTFRDREGNFYHHSLLYYYGSSQDYDRYCLDGQYRVFEGIVFVPQERYSGSEGDAVYIYGDGELLWSSSVMYYDSLPERFSVDVTGVTNLDIVYSGGAITWPLAIGVGELTLR